jgi:large subunit ribosomal protein L25
VGEIALQAEPRDQTGKGAARKMRADGRIPAICYRRNAASVSISLDPHSLHDLIRNASAGVNTLFDLKMAGGGDFDGRQVLVKDIQRDPVSGDYLHADLFAVDLKEKIHVSVPIHLTGSAEGVTLGGILDHALRELEIQCLPGAIPEEFSVDVSALDIGMSIHVRDLTLPDDVELLVDPNLSIVSVVAPAVEEEVPEEEELEEGAEAPVAEGEEGAPATPAEPSEEKSGD